MELRLNWQNKKDVERLKNSIRKGDLFIGSTDTVLGIMAKVAPGMSKKIDNVKHRGGKPYLVLVDSIQKVSRLACMSNDVKRKLNRLWPAPITVILPKNPDAPLFIGSQDTVAIRIPDHQQLRECIKDLPFGLFSTSANISGESIPLHIDDVCEQITDAIPLYIDDKNQKEAQASTIIDLTNDKLTLVRKGSYSMEKIKEILCGLAID